jgi:hypothetical protein
VDALPYLDKEYDKPAMRDLVDRWALAQVTGRCRFLQSSCATRPRSHRRAAVRAQILFQASAPRASSRTRYSLTLARSWAHASVPARLHLRIAT